jgi:hypothetical protein
MPKTKLAVAAENLDNTEPNTEPTPAETPEVVEITFRATTFTIPKDRDKWNTEGYLALMEAVEQNAYAPYMRAAKKLLGPNQWARLQTLGDVRADFDEFLALFLPASLEECVG